MTNEDKLHLIRDELDGQRMDLKGGLRLLRDLVKARQKVSKFIKIVPLPDDVVLARLKEGQAAVQREELDIDSSELVDYANDITRVFRRHELLTNSAFDGGSYLDGCRKGVYEPAGMGESGGLKEPGIDYLGVQVLRPLYEGYRESYLSLLSKGEWAHPYCPLCGSSAVIAKRIGDAGKRHLCCGVCDASWPYDMFKCPFCGNESQETLSLQIEREDRCRAECCKRCNGYIKMVDLRGGGTEDMFIELEDIKSYRLDVAAKGDGLLSGDCIGLR